MLSNVAIMLAQDWLAKYDLPYVVRINENLNRRLGQCYHPCPKYPQGLIELSHSFVVRNGVARVEQTIKHEVSHARVGPGYGHGPVWKAMAASMGVPPVACAGNSNARPRRWMLVCLNCGLVLGYYAKRSRKALRLRHRLCRPIGVAFMPNPQHEDENTNLDVLKIMATEATRRNILDETRRECFFQEELAKLRREDELYLEEE